MSKPSDIKGIYPWSSVFGTAETETIALNVAIILARTSDTFHVLSFGEYSEERTKDFEAASGGGKQRASFNAHLERPHFEKAAPYLASAEGAAKVCPEWAEALKGEGHAKSFSDGNKRTGNGGPAIPQDRTGLSHESAPRGTVVLNPQKWISLQVQHPG